MTDIKLPDEIVTVLKAMQDRVKWTDEDFRSLRIEPSDLFLAAERISLEIREASVRIAGAMQGRHI